MEVIFNLLWTGSTVATMMESERPPSPDTESTPKRAMFVILLAFLYWSNSSSIIPRSSVLSLVFPFYLIFL